MIFTRPWILTAAVPVIAAVAVLLTGAGVRKLRGTNRRTFVLTAAAVLAGILAAAGLSRWSDGSGTQRVFVLDVSDSIGPFAAEEARRYTQTLVSALPDGDENAVVVFAAEPSVERVLQKGKWDAALSSEVSGKGSDIEQALLSAFSLFSGRGAKQIILLSDGIETAGNAENAARFLRANGVRLNVYPLSSSYADEVLLSGMNIPEHVPSGQVFPVTVSAESSLDTAGKLVILKDGSYFGEEAVNLKKGINSFTYTLQFETGGMHTVDAVLFPETDTLSENNRFGGYVEVGEFPDILYVVPSGKGQTAGETPFSKALQTQGFRIKYISPGEFPSGLYALTEYRSIIFDNVPAGSFPLQVLRTIESYVGDTGGGFLMLGGKDSFGPGGYYNTPVEKLLPVEMAVDASMKLPGVSLIIMIDKSGSMSGGIDGDMTKLDLVKQAAASAIEVLNPFYTVGVLTFDARYNWAVPVMEAQNSTAILENLAPLSSEGGTHLYEALVEAVLTQKESTAGIKHILILSDGITRGNDFDTLLTQCRENHITISTVAVGEDANRSFMEELAETTGGRSYYTNSLRSVPQIFAAETMIATRKMIVEEQFFPMLDPESDFFRGADLTIMPPIEGYVRTYGKPGAVEAAEALDGDPLIAGWRYGLGKSAVFTSDSGEKWAAGWTHWTAYPQIAAQLCRWLLRPVKNFGREITSGVENGVWTITLEITDETGRYVNGYSFAASIAVPGNGHQTIAFEQTGPGTYEGTVPLSQSGDYIAAVYARENSQSGSTPDSGPEPFVPEIIGYRYSYPPEYNIFFNGRSGMEHLVSLTGGEVLRGNPGEDAVLLRDSAEGSHHSPNLLLFPVFCVLFFFLLELAARKTGMPGPKKLLRLLPGGRRKEESTADLSREIDMKKAEERRKKEMDYLTRY